MTWLRRLWCKTFHFPRFTSGGLHCWDYTCDRCQTSWTEAD